MARKSKKDDAAAQVTAVIQRQPITDTLKENFMPYAMSVILSRAIPEIDGFKPAHRKLLFMMYKMGLLSGARTKSANIVGATMKLNPHGDAAIYETMVRLARGNESLLHPFVDSKGNFGKIYSRDMQYAAPRYTEAKLEPICAELFKNIDRDAVDFVDNYDGQMKEPSLLPTTFPNILASPNLGIAVGMSSRICPFNLAELCDTAIAYLEDENCDISSTLKAPDFPTGGELIFDKKVIDQIYSTGTGTFSLRAKYNYDEKQNCIDVTEIPYTTTIEAIIEKLADLVKGGSLREINDVRNEIGIDGFRLTIDLKRGTDPEKLMQRLFKLTTLQDTFSCNFNVLIGGTPRVMGVREILSEWTAFRVDCIRRQTYFELQKCREKLHLLQGLEKILLDIDKAIRIVRETEEEAEVVPNLMIGFGIDEKQAEYVAEIKLRHLNREYIINRTAEIKQLEEEIKKLEGILDSRKKVLKIISNELADVKKKYGKPRKTDIVFSDEIQVYDETSHIDDYPVTLFFTAESYFKKITPQSLRMGSEHKLKENDVITQTVEATNKSELIFFTNKARAYKTFVYEFDDMKASVLGEYIPSKLGMDPDEQAVFMAVTTDYSGRLLLFFRDGRAVKLELKSYETKQNRKKLVNAFYEKSPLVAAYQITEDSDFALFTDSRRVVLLNSAQVPMKATRSSQGIIAITLKRGASVIKAVPYTEGMFVNPKAYRARALPVAGSFIKNEDSDEEQLSL